ncbi:MAG: putative dsRNA-binding protein [Bacteroidia bacterium]
MKMHIKDKDYKSRLVSWCQRENVSIDFIDDGTKEPNMFEVVVKIGDVYYGRGRGRRKKQAHQKAAESSIAIIEKEGRKVDEL